MKTTTICPATTRPATGPKDSTLLRGEESRNLFRVPGGFTAGMFGGKPLPLRFSPYGENFAPERVAALSPLEFVAQAMIPAATIGETLPLWQQDNADRPADLVGGFVQLIHA